VCSNPECLFNIKIRNGEIIINEPVGDGSQHAHTYRSMRDSQRDNQRDPQRG
jgi:hypothetical protein